MKELTRERGENRHNVARWSDTENCPGVREGSLEALPSNPSIYELMLRSIRQERGNVCEVSLTKGVHNVQDGIRVLHGFGLFMNSNSTSVAAGKAASRS